MMESGGRRFGAGKEYWKTSQLGSRKWEDREAEMTSLSYERGGD